MMTKRKRRLAALKGWRSRKRNPSKRSIRKRVGAALKKWIRGNPFEAGLSRAWYNNGRNSARRARFTDMYEAWHAEKKKPQTPGKRVTAQESFYQGYMDVAQARGNPSRVQGRKVKGGRAVTLKNMKTVTITRHRNGAVSVRGVQLKGRKR
jgi:hypothetical protein